MIIRYLKLKQRVNSLPSQIFSLFWLTFLLLSLISFFVPRLDARVYAELEGEELATYQNEIILSIRHNRIDHLINDEHDHELDSFPLEKISHMERPVLVDQNQVIIGAHENEIKALQKFIYQADNPLKPMKKRFNDIQVAGPFLIHISDPENTPYMLYFVKNVDPQKEFISFIFDHPFIMLLLIMLVSSPLLWLLAWSISKPIRALHLSAQAVAKGDFTINKALEEQGASELRQVGRSFNHMTQSLEELISSQQSLLSAISHELRTPLTRLQLASALIRRRHGETTELLRIETETERLDKMINDLLLLSRQQLKSHLSRDVFSINEIWDDIFEDAKFEAEQRHLSFSITQKISHPQRWKINGNLGLLSSAVENVLRNALKYTHSKIEASISIHHQTLNICIDDDGAGVAETEYEQIFLPFYRVDEARTRQTGGAGLGLAIVANVLQQHQGEVYAEKSPLGGLRIQIKLPLWLA